MHDKMGMGSVVDLDKFVDLKFADKACSDADKLVKNKKISEEDLSTKVKQLTNKSIESEKDVHSKEALNMEGKYLIFNLGNERYGIEILKIVEIIKMVPITSVPNTPDFVKGVINLRGSIVPTIDLRLRIGLEPVEYGNKTRILISEDERDGVKLRVGFIVDAVEVICDVNAEDIESSSSFNEQDDDQFILGAVKSKDGIYLLLNLPMIITPINSLGKEVKKKELV
jgi:chemotaxis signal transduction protein